MGPRGVEFNSVGLPSSPKVANIGRKRLSTPPLYKKKSSKSLTKSTPLTAEDSKPRPATAATTATSTAISPLPLPEMSESSDDDTSIKVIVRIRPFLGFELQNTSVPKTSVVHELPNGKTVKMDTTYASHAVGRSQFTFDATYGIESTQAQVFNKSIRPLVNSCMEGYNATVLAYGQTGSGKTHSILGQTDQSDPNLDPGLDTSEAGVIPRALRALFISLREMREKRVDSTHHRYDYNVKVQFLELYGEDIRDLLQPDPSNAPKLSIRDGRTGVEPEVVNIKEVTVSTSEEALLCLTRGTLRRVTRATAMNAESSRSHAIMSVIIQQTLTTLSEDGKTAKEITTKGSKLHFVDLAGSERIKKTGVTGQGLKEGVNINKGLLVLGNVISALASQADANKNAGFVPYRDSKLTRLLKGSLGGNHKTLMVACVSPSGSNTEETLNTLRYANRAKNIQNKAVVNMDAGSKMITELRDQLKAMAVEFMKVRSMVGPDVELDGEGTVFTEKLLLALIGGNEVKIDLKKGKISASATPASPTARPVTAAATTPVADSSPVADLAVQRPKTASSVTSQLDLPTLAQLEEGQKAVSNVKRLRRALEKSDDRVIETERQLEWVREELRLSREEVNALAENAAERSGTDNDSCSASGVSALTEDFEMPRLSQETYETVKSIYEEKLIQMTLELKEREDERENIAMTLYRHESDSQRLFYVKNTLTEDLARKEEQIAELKSELRDVSQLKVIPNAAPQTERQFRRLRVRGSKRMAANASMSMSSYYTEKLNKIERHIKLREEECTSLGQELEKLEADSQIFTDLAKDLSDRLKAKDQSMHKKSPELNQMTQQQLSRLNVVIEKDREEREQLEAELKRLKDDSETFSALVKALTDERKTKLEHVEKYKRRHRELAVSVGMTSPYVEGGEDDVDDDASVSSTWSFMSIDSVTTSGTQQSNSAQSQSLGTITKIEYDQRLSTLEANITKHEEDRVFILNDLEKLEADTHAFAELSTSLKQKLKTKEEQIQKLRKDLDDFSERLQKQEKELAGLTSEEAAGVAAAAAAAVTGEGVSEPPPPQVALEGPSELPVESNEVGEQTKDIEVR